MRKLSLVIHFLTALLLCGVFVYANKNRHTDKREIKNPVGEKQQAGAQARSPQQISPSLLIFEIK
jgi:hypothetical protein